MKTNLDQWSRRKPGGLYLIELRQRLAREKGPRKKIEVHIETLNSIHRPGALLEQIAASSPEPIEAV
jgi:hypothetical protein